MSEAAPKVAALVGRLAPIHRRCIQHALQFLREIEPRATRMNPDNLSICFAPCFFRCSDMMLALANAQKEILFTKLLIVTLPLTGAWPYNSPCAQQYVGKSQSCMVTSAFLHAYRCAVRGHCRRFEHEDQLGGEARWCVAK